MENRGYHEDSEWPAKPLPIRFKQLQTITSENGNGEILFTTDGFGNVILPDQTAYEQYEDHLKLEERNNRKSA